MSCVRLRFLCERGLLGGRRDWLLYVYVCVCVCVLVCWLCSIFIYILCVKYFVQIVYTNSLQGLFDFISRHVSMKGEAGLADKVSFK